ncbi:MAG TPA: ABC transporter permease [Steroidobacteraceae bacterium]|jgi:putative ABC transport system permease protein|nr:ABC transporter permease [Steroidobacteraceae bacterium]
MFRNYLTVALRNLIRHKLYSIINIAGLTVGLACVLFIILFARDELSYDKWIPDTANLYRLELTIHAPSRPPMAFADIAYPMPAAMRDEVPGVTGMTRLSSEPMTLTSGDRQFPESVNVVDPNFFQVIKLPVVIGDPAQILKQPESVVLTESAARKFFGNANPIGKTITDGKGKCGQSDTACRDSTVPLTVTGVIRDLPHNTQISGEVFIPNTSIADYSTDEVKQSWFSQSGWGWVTLAPGTDPGTINAKMKPLLDRALGPMIKQLGFNNLTGSQAYEVHLTPFTQVHLTSDHWSYNLTAPGSMAMFYGVIAIGMLILLVACFNFMNLATARAMMRAREISLRKTVGAKRSQLVFQFLGESVLMALLGLILALALVEMLLPAFGSFMQRPLTVDLVSGWPVLLLILAVAVAAGLIGGSYPAVILSGFRPATVLRTNSSGQGGSGRLRATLVVLQFAVSIGLGIAAAVVFGQISYARGLELGFQRDNILVIGHAGRIFMDGRQSFVQALRANPGILDMTLSDIVPFDQGQNNDAIKLPGAPDLLLFTKVVINPSFPTFYGMRLLAGRQLSATRALDEFSSMNAGDVANTGHSILINESAAARLGFTPEQAVGKTILYDTFPVVIVGVLADAKFAGAREPVRPTDYVYDPKAAGQVSVRLRPDMIPQTVTFIDKAWHTFAPIASVNRHFLDDSFGQLYQDEERQGQIFGIFVAIAIFIACLGLFGLAAFTAGRRTKEIGLRKVFGGRTGDVVKLLLWQFSIPALIANLIAWPLAWYYLHDWLDGYAYRISLSPLYFLGAAAVALLIAWLTVLSHAVRVARATPIGALRYE